MKKKIAKRVTAYILAGMMAMTAAPQNGALIFAGAEEEYSIQEELTDSEAPAGEIAESVPENVPESTPESLPNEIPVESTAAEAGNGETATSSGAEKEIVFSAPESVPDIAVEEPEELILSEESPAQNAEEIVLQPEEEPGDILMITDAEEDAVSTVSYSNENDQDVKDGLVPYLGVEIEKFTGVFEDSVSVAASRLKDEDVDRYMDLINKAFAYPQTRQTEVPGTNLNLTETPAPETNLNLDEAAPENNLNTEEDPTSENESRNTGATEKVTLETMLPLEIELFDNGGQPYITDDKLTVKIHTEKPEQYVSCQLYHIKHDDTIEKLNFIIYDPEEEELDPYIQFNTDGLSPFIFVSEKTELIPEPAESKEEHTDEETVQATPEENTESKDEIINADPDETEKKEEEAEEKPEEDLVSIYAGNPSAADIVAGPEDVAAATTTVTQKAAVKGRRSLKSNASGVDWTFDNYYIEKQAVAGNHLSKIDDFLVKYQMDIHFSRDVEQGKCVIRIPQTLFADKRGIAYKPKSIPVPMGTPGNYTESIVTPFNYYEDGDDLVFWNFRSIVSGTNASIQVLYPTEDILEVPDGTEWSITPEISVEYPETTETGTGVPLTGEINTYARLKTLEKRAADYSSVSYTPGIYTINQIQRFAPTATIPQPFEDYVYALWRIDGTGNGTQEYEVYLKDIPQVEDGTPGIIVGFSANVQLMTSGPYAGYYKLTRRKQRTFNTRNDINGDVFTVVTAYPKSSITSGSTLLQNDVEMVLHPVDGLDEDSVLTDSAEWVYQDYEWTYSGDTIGIDKFNSDNPITGKKDFDYKGWLSVYRAMREKGLDTAGPRFDTHGLLRSFNLTHYTDKLSSGNYSIGDYRPGAYIKTTTVDDIMIAYPIDGAHAGESLRLTDEDYYFNSATIIVNEAGYDIYEDETTAPTDEHAQIDRTCRFYAMFAGSDEWELVGSLPYNANGTYIYKLTPEQIAREPYKVKTEFNSTEYYLTQIIEVGMTIRHDSPVFGQILDSETVRVENLSGIYGWYVSNAEPGRYIQDTSIHDTNYSEQDVLELTQDWYGTILMRDAAFGTLRAASPHAAASKSVTARSDTEVGRVKLTYTAKAFESYDVYSQDAVYALRTAGVQTPDRTEVEFYDLLPPHVKFDISVPVTAGRLNRIDLSSKKTPSTAWLKRDVTVTVNPETDVIDNWNNTGRMMVIFHVSCDLEESSMFDDSSRAWFTGYGIEFGAYVDWEDLKTMYDEPNIVAYMPVSSDTRPLLGKDTEVSLDDGNPVTSMYNEDNYLIFGSDINGDGVTNIRNVLFADSLELENFPIATESGIVKKVRADKDLFAMYGKSTAVSCNEGYTYQINVQNSSRYDIKDIVIFDRLENAAIDRRVEEPGMNFEADGWHGTFRDITTSDLDRNDIAYVIYYNTNRNAVIPATDGDPYTVLSGNGWVRADAYTGNVADVKAIAVDISKKTNGDDFLVHNGESIGFNVRMRAPGTLQTYEWAYNNPSFYSTTIGDTNVSQTVIGNSVKVKLKNAKNIVVEKKYKGTVPADVLDTEYEFTLQRRSTGAKLTDQIYELFEKNASTGVYEPVEDEGTLSTDARGRLYLYPNQKAVFYGITDAEDIEAVERDLPNWEATVTETETADAHNILVENEYRPVVYMKKITAAVPAGVNVSTRQFSFLVKENGTPAANRTLWVVSTIPKGNNPPEILGTKTTDENGVVTLHANEALCMRLGAIGNTWSVEELNTSYGEGTDWICEEPSKTGRASTTPGSAVIQNIYRYKKLNLSKGIVNQTASSCTQSFTFKIWKVNDGATPSGNDPSLYATPAAGLSWTGGYSPNSGTTDANGEFTTRLAGKTGIISGLIGGCTYVIQETVSGADYKPDKEFYMVKVPLFATTVNTNITNTYQKVGLEIRKTVLSTATISSSKTFNIKVEVKEVGSDTWVPLANTSVKVYTASGGYSTKTTSADGVIAIPANGKAIFTDIARLGDQYRVSEETDVSYPPLYPNAEEYDEGTFALGTNESNIINGSGDALYIRKKYVAGDTDSGSVSIANAINNVSPSYAYLTENGTDSWSSYQRFSAYAYLEVNEGSGWRRITPEDTNYQFYVIKGANVQSLPASAYNQNGAFLIPVGATIAVQIADGSIRDVQYRITETGIKESYQKKNAGAISKNTAGSENDPGEINWLVEDSSNGNYWVNAGKTSVVVEQNGNTNNQAILQNSVNAIYSYKLTKQTYYEYGGNLNVPTGSVVAFRFEKFDGSNWVPAEGVRYYTNENPNQGASDRIQYTGPDGMVYVTKIDNVNPIVYMPKEARPYTKAQNAKTGDIRIVEIPEETDEAFGHFASYFDSHTNGTISNQCGGTVFEVSKVTSEKTDAIFTFKLSGKDKNGNTLITDCSRGVPYVVYDAATNEIISTGRTSENGTFELMGGQYARITMPRGVWTVTETEPHPWVLDSVDINDEARETKYETSGVFNAYPAYIDTSSIENIKIAEQAKAQTTTHIYVGSKAEYASQIAGYEGITMDVNKTGLIKGYYVPNGDDTYSLYIISENSDKVKVSYTGVEFRYFQSSLKYADVHGMDTSSAKSLNYMFSPCQQLEKVDGFNTLDFSNVEQLSYAFQFCSKLQEIDLSGISAPNLNHIGYMFGNCTNLKKIDMHNVYMPVLVNTYDFTYCCYALEKLDISNSVLATTANGWSTFSFQNTGTNTPNGCEIDLHNTEMNGNNFINNNEGVYTKISKLNLTNAKIVGSMRYFINGCIIYDVVGFNTMDISEVTDISYMLGNIPSLKSLNISGMNFENVTVTNDVIRKVYNLKEIDISNTKIGKEGKKIISSSNNFFETCPSLQTVNAQNFLYTGTCCYIHLENRPLKYVDFSGARFPHLQASGTTFFWPSGTTDLVVNFSNTHFGTLNYLFRNLVAHELNVTGLTGEKIPYEGMDEYDSYCDANYTFQNATVDNIVGLSTMDLSKVRRACYTFAYIITNEIIMPNMNLEKCKDINSMFYNVKKAKKIDISGMYAPNICKEGNLTQFISGDVLEEIDMSDCVFGTDDSASGIRYYDEIILTSPKLTKIDMSNTKFADSATYGSKFNSFISLNESNPDVSLPLTIDLTGFQFGRKANLNQFFRGCTRLKTIYCNDDWSTMTDYPDTDNPDVNTNVFDINADSLLTGAVPYSTSNKGVGYANPTTGYFTRKSA